MAAVVVVPMRMAIALIAVAGRIAVERRGLVVAGAIHPARLVVPRRPMDIVVAVVAVVAITVGGLGRRLDEQRQAGEQGDDEDTP